MTTHYPIGFVFGAREIEQDFPDEAMALGVITILWNRLELRLKSMFEAIMGDQRAFATALWDSQNTHRGRFKLLELARDTVPLTAKRRALLQEILDRVEDLSRRRNTLIHGEFVVEQFNGVDLLARTHRGAKEPTYTPSDMTSLNKMIEALRETDAIIGALSLDYLPKDLLDSVTKTADELRAAGKIK